VGHFNVPAALLPRKCSGYPSSERLSCPQRWSGRWRDEKHLLLLPGTEPRFLGYPVHTIVPITIPGIFSHYVPNVSVYESYMHIYLQPEALQLRNLIHIHFLVIFAS
jgi:hypothetical protein